MNITVDSFDLLDIAICEVLRYYVPDEGDRYRGEPWRPAYREWLLNVRHNADFTGSYPDEWKPWHDAGGGTGFIETALDLRSYIRPPETDDDLPRNIRAWQRFVVKEVMGLAALLVWVRSCLKSPHLDTDDHRKAVTMLIERLAWFHYQAIEAAVALGDKTDVRPHRCP